RSGGLAHSRRRPTASLPPRSTAGHLPLEQVIGVRIPGGQPIFSIVGAHGYNKSSKRFVHATAVNRTDQKLLAARHRRARTQPIVAAVSRRSSHQLPSLPARL